MRVAVGNVEVDYDPKTVFDDVAMQEMLCRAHVEHSEVSCLCSASRPPVIVRHYADRGYALARAPGSGLFHDDWCSWFTATDDHSRLFGTYTNEAVYLDDGQLHVAYAHGERTPPAAVTVSGLRDILLLSAGLNEYSAETGAPRWDSVHAALVKASTQIILDGKSLSDRLFVPPPFKKDGIESVERQLDGIASTNPQSFFVLSRVASLKASPYGLQMRLKHLPNSPFWLSETLSKAIPKQIITTLDSDQNDPSTGVLCLAEVTKSKSVGFKVIASSFVKVLASTLPCYTHYNEHLFSKLINDNINFSVSMSFDATDDLLREDAFMLHGEGGDEMVPCYVIHDSGGVSKRKKQMIDRLRTSGRKVWLWDVAAVSGLIPALTMFA